jgi:hypothetical protein
LCSALVACSTAPVSSPSNLDAAPPAAPLTPQAAYERKLQDQVSTALRQKRLADAATASELLTVLRPDDAAYRAQLADVQRQIDAGVASRLPRASQAAQRGELDQATQLYLSVLALQPSNDAAADALRAIERERNKRSYLGRFSRVTITRHAVADAEMSAGVAAGMAERNDLEHAALLAGDGEYEDAIGLLERRLAGDRQDLATRRLLADIYYRQAESLLPRDRPAALAALEMSARAYPAEPRAANRLRQLRQPERRAAVAASPAAASSAGSVARPTPVSNLTSTRAAAAP